MINIRQRLSHPFRLLLLLIPIVSLCSYLVMGDFLRWWVLLPALVQIALLVFAYWHPKVALSTFLVVAVLIGRGLRWRERRFERDWQAERDRAQAEQMRRNAEIADRIHDAVTGDLALAAVMKQQEMERDDCPNRDLLVQINERVQMALANVHRVIGPA